MHYMGIWISPGEENTEKSRTGSCACGVSLPHGSSTANRESMDVGTRPNSVAGRLDACRRSRGGHGYECGR
jgi:hypothetical protein